MPARRRGAPTGPTEAATTTLKRRPKSKEGLTSRAFFALVVTCVTAVVLYYLVFAGPTVLAGPHETISHLRFGVPCATRPLLTTAPPARGCLPRGQCARVVVDGKVAATEAAALVRLAKKAFLHAGGAGGASIVDLHRGIVSYGEGFVDLNTLMDNAERAGKEVDPYSADDKELYFNISQRVKGIVMEEFGLDALYLTSPTFISRITARPARTMHDEYWHLHVDKDAYPTFEYTALLYLSQAGDEFAGGEFIFQEQDGTKYSVSPVPGRLVVFTSGDENTHHVTKVSSGVRYALTLGFTCDESSALSSTDFLSSLVR